MLANSLLACSCLTLWLSHQLVRWDQLTCPHGENGETETPNIAYKTKNFYYNKNLMRITESPSPQNIVSIFVIVLLSNCAFK